jgi:aconitate hydratase
MQGKFVEYFGEGAASLSVPDRATISNVALEYGATMASSRSTTPRSISRQDRPHEGGGRGLLEAYFRAQGLFGMPAAGAIDYSQTPS